MSRTITPPVRLLTLLVLVGLAAPAAAGPPLLCHPFEIGGAASLPWDGTGAYWRGRAGYRIQDVVRDTEALLTPGAPVIVRMETLRRAAIYASADAQVAERLYATLEARLKQSEAAGRPDATAMFDVAYLTETYRQIADLDRFTSEFQGRGSALRAIIGQRDGYALVTRVLALGGSDASIEFAAALMRGRRDDAFRAHAERARAGAVRDALLARNLDHIS